MEHGIGALALIFAATSVARTAVSAWRVTGSVAAALSLAFVASEIVVLAHAELTSVVGLYGATTAAAFWAVAAALVPELVRRLPSAEQTHAVPRRHRPGPWEVALLAVGGGFLLATGVAAWFAAPNTADALIYHLPRISQWIQNGTVAHFATPATKQLYMPPLAEMLSAHSFFFTGGDRLVNFVQFSAYGAAAAAAYAVTREAHVPRLAALAGAQLVLSLPIAVLQASGPKNDLVLCANLAAAGFCFVRAWRCDSIGWWGAGALALGLSVLTKSTGLLFGPVVAALAVAAAWRRSGWRCAVARAALVLTAVFFVAGPHHLRNLRLFGDPLGEPLGVVGLATTNARHDAGVLLSNLTRNAALHFATPWPAWNRRVEQAVAALHDRFQLALDDPATTWPVGRFEVAEFPDNREDYAANPLHFLLILMALGASLLVPGGWDQRSLARALAAGLIVASVGFCLLLKWQVWHSRLHLPLFLGGCVLAALAAARSPRLAAATTLLVSLFSLAPLLANWSRPLIGGGSVFERTRLEMLLVNFYADPSAEAALRGVIADLGRVQPQTLGIHYRTSEEAEYLVWWAARRALGSPPRLRHVGVVNETAWLVDARDPVAAVVSFGAPRDLGYARLPGRETEPPLIELDGHRYALDSDHRLFTVWVAVDPRDVSSATGRESR